VFRAIGKCGLSGQSRHNRASQNIPVQYHLDFLKVVLKAADPRPAFTGPAILNYTRRRPHTPPIVWDSLPVLAQFLPPLPSAPRPVCSCTLIAYTRLPSPLRLRFHFPWKSSFHIITPGEDALTITEYLYVTSGVSAHDTTVPVLDTFVKGVPVVNMRPGGGLPIPHASR
jgi:hypothetical protein